MSAPHQSNPPRRHSDRPHPDRWIKVLPEGLYVEPGGFYIDPVRPVERAVVTHGHSDHARPGNRHVLATPGTLAIMRQRMGAGVGGSLQPLEYGEGLRIGDVGVRLVPAGHVLGSAQVVLEHAGSRVVVSGDYKRRHDRTCAAFEPVPCDVFVTEATFGLPVFRHPPDLGEVQKLLHSMALFPERSHVVGVYALGKCQRLITLLRAAGYDRPIWLHGALEPLCRLYQELGVELGELRPATVAAKEDLKGALVLGPPAAVADRWARRLADPVVAMASGWMRVRQRARQRGVELPLVISDHADWDELCQTLEDVGAPEVWVTHGREEALVHYATSRGIRARALALIGFEDEDSEGISGGALGGDAS
ncbi:ligase-associated DNA damage response exonuclease [Azospirillum sp. YIM B02556]|uniref:Ligase-associated DNA damage response exonuclease n=1 Tax=Azospirillum endophyticum TaxID=2800326 RepID=A0ABS1EZC8_9PROT|nr:ligase-associated DNA damage response exonuclease [Azospirillum endophyticum]MBK1836527.1 ligase-associated DNA damage response exonuclease [Azospirillum endophyticum]